MNNLFVPHNIALALKEIGFDELCLGYYNHKEKFFFANPSASQDFIPHFYHNTSNMWKPMFITDKSKDKCCTAPLYDQVIDWFIEKHKLWIDSYPNLVDEEKIWYPELCSLGNPKSLIETKDYPSRKEALNAGILKAIELIKNKEK